MYKKLTYILLGVIVALICLSYYNHKRIEKLEDCEMVQITVPSGPVNICTYEVGD